MYTVEFIDGPWEGHTYATESRHEEIEPKATQTGGEWEEGVYVLISEEHNNILRYKFSPQTSQ